MCVSSAAIQLEADLVSAESRAWFLAFWYWLRVVYVVDPSIVFISCQKTCLLVPGSWNVLINYIYFAFL